MGDVNHSEGLDHSLDLSTFATVSNVFYTDEGNSRGGRIAQPMKLEADRKVDIKIVLPITFLMIGDILSVIGGILLMIGDIPLRIGDTHRVAQVSFWNNFER